MKHNYALQKFKEPLEREPCELLPKSEVNQIFGKIGPLIPIHDEICRQLRNMVVHWNEKHPIGSVWLKAVPLFSRLTFVPFFVAGLEL